MKKIEENSSQNEENAKQFLGVQYAIHRNTAS